MLEDVDARQQVYTSIRASGLRGAQIDALLYAPQLYMKLAEGDRQKRQLIGHRVNQAHIVEQLKAKTIFIENGKINNLINS